MPEGTKVDDLYKKLRAEGKSEALATGRPPKGRENVARPGKLDPEGNPPYSVYDAEGHLVGYIWKKTAQDIHKGNIASIDDQKGEIRLKTKFTNSVKIFPGTREEAMKKYPSKMILEDAGQVWIFDSVKDYDNYRQGIKNSHFEAGRQRAMNAIKEMRANLISAADLL